MNSDYSVLREPVTGARLELADNGQTLVAPSGARYPIVRNIPRFVDSENYASDFGKQWNLFPRTQLDSHVNIPISEDRLQRCFGAPLSELKGKRVLEAGSGAGRFTEVLLKYGARLDSFDYSNAVEANAANNGGHKDLVLVQGDIRQPPFEAASYDVVICLGVLQHTQSPEESVASLWTMVKPGGLLVIDHYRRGLGLRLPPPIGGAKEIYRRYVLRLPAEKRYDAVEKITRFWFPYHWKARNSRLAQKLLGRVSPVIFYYPGLPLRDREAHYEWSLLDTHDSLTDYYKHYRDERQIETALKGLGAEQIHVSRGGNGVEARCRKPVAPTDR